MPARVASGSDPQIRPLISISRGPAAPILNSTMAMPVHSTFDHIVQRPGGVDDGQADLIGHLQVLGGRATRCSKVRSGWRAYSTSAGASRQIATAGHQPAMRRAG